MITPDYASWTNLVDVGFGVVERQVIRRGVFKSVTELNTKIPQGHRGGSRSSIVSAASASPTY